MKSHRLLLHVCCGPCGTSTHRYWFAEGADLVGFFYNPNIQPLMEFRRRVEGVRDLAQQLGMPLVEDLSYDPAHWFSQVMRVTGGGGEEPQDSTSPRCARCIGMRMERAAREAVAQQCEAFSTTLSISPWQDHEVIRAQGREASARHGVEFLYRDLRPLYPESRRLSREWGLYRQKYCGCLVSEWERYRDS
ncbi:MAG: epoxyqueuosine reductase QueH [Actinobacteria bacterium]|nr:epoxyqueuosine reductase QueH [Actinomycetota bacterium]